MKYIVQRGDTLGNIAVKYGTTVQAIAQVNGIRHPDMIYKGQILRIPTPYYDDNNNHHHMSHKHHTYDKHHDHEDNNYDHHDNSHH